MPRAPPLARIKLLQEKKQLPLLLVTGGIPLDAPNAYSDDDQSIYQQAINGMPYYGMQVCFGSPFQYLPKEAVTRDEFACMLTKAIKAGSATDLTGSSDPYSDEGASQMDV